jgi:hypothetical protein
MNELLKIAYGRLSKLEKELGITLMQIDQKVFLNGVVNLSEKELEAYTLFKHIRFLEVDEV